MSCVRISTERDLSKWYTARTCEMSVQGQSSMQEAETEDLTASRQHKGTERRTNLTIAPDTTSIPSWTDLQRGLNTLTFPRDTFWLTLDNNELKGEEGKAESVGQVLALLSIPDMDFTEMQSGQEGSLLMLCPTSRNDYSHGRLIIDDNVTVSSPIFDLVLQESRQVESVDFGLNVESDLMMGGQQDVTATYLPGLQRYFTGNDEDRSDVVDHSTIIKGLYSPLSLNDLGRLAVTEIEDNGRVRHVWDHEGHRLERDSSERCEEAHRDQDGNRAFFGIVLKVEDTPPPAQEQSELDKCGLAEAGCNRILDRNQQKVLI